MYRQGLLRCARQARVTSLRAVARPSSALLRTQFSPISPAVQAIQPARLSLASRLYSTEAAAPEATEHDAAAEESVDTSFAGLEAHGVHPNLLKAITHDMGMVKMTPVQAQAIAPALSGSDIVAQAKTGTGKTLAFLLPILQRMIDSDPSLATRKASWSARSDDIRAIVLSPTRELAEQIAREAKRVTRHTGLVVQCAVGGTQKSSMLRQTRSQGCHLMVATPGRLNDLLQDPRSGIDAPKLDALVLDEADCMLDIGFERELNEIIDALPKPEEKVRQTLLVSATIPDKVIKLARTMVRASDFKFIQTIPENESLTHDHVPQHLIPTSSWANVFPSLIELIEKLSAEAKADPSARPVKAIVFLGTANLVQFATDLAFHRKRDASTRDMPRISSIHSRLTQQQRQRAADDFRSAKSAVLFSTSVTARGMDFPEVTHVIQVDTPNDRDSYIHRIGRTGRVNKAGEAYLILPPSSTRKAKELLNGLPLRPADGLVQSAEVDTSSGELPQLHAEIKSYCQALGYDRISEVYTGLLGAAMSRDRASTVDDLNEWTTTGCGLDEPPAVSYGIVQRLGLARTNVNVASGRGHDGDRPQSSQRFGRSNDRRSRDSDDMDPFSDMNSMRRDDRPRSNGFRGRRGGSSDYGSRRDNRNSDPW